VHGNAQNPLDTFSL